MNINFSGKYILQCSRAEQAARFACQEMQKTNSDVQNELNTIRTNQSEVDKLQTDIFEKQKELDELSKKPFKTLETPQQITSLYGDISEKQNEISKKQIEIQEKQLSIMKLRNFAFILNGKELAEGDERGKGSGAKLITNGIVSEKEDLFESEGNAKIISGLKSFDVADYFAIRNGLAEAYKDIDERKKQRFLKTFDKVFMKPLDYQGNKVIDLKSWENGIIYN